MDDIKLLSKIEYLTVKGFCCTAKDSNGNYKVLRYNNKVFEVCELPDCSRVDPKSLKVSYISSNIDDFSDLEPIYSYDKCGVSHFGYNKLSEDLILESLVKEQ